MCLLLNDDDVFEAYGAVAAAAFGRRLQMRCVLTGCGHAIVATAASTDRAAVIESGAGPRSGVVAATALGCRRQVRRVFTRCFEAVVASAARVGDTGVVEAGAKPGIRAMANVAFRRCLRVCRMFACCGGSVMAGAATSHHGAMIDPAHPVEGNGVVAVVAGRDHGDVRSGYTKHA